MNRKIRILLISAISLAVILAAFLAGAYSYRSGLISTIKRALVQTAPQPTPTVPVIEPGFDFNFLSDPGMASLNDLPLDQNPGRLRFLVAGHIYGKPGDDEFHPSPNLVTQIALLNQIDLDFAVFLGDMVWKPTPDNFNRLELLILDQITFPAFNVVGNHDVTIRENYLNRYGDTVFAFKYKGQLFLFLDTTLKYYDLTPQQYDFIQSVIDDRASDVTSIHIFMHHVLFLDEEEIIPKQLVKPNEGDGRSPGFQEFIASDLISLSQETPIYVYSGDVGAFEGGNLSPLFKKSAAGQITFLATGLGGSISDSVLILESEPSGAISIQAYSLTGQVMKEIEEYSFENWLLK